MRGINIAEFGGPDVLQYDTNLEKPMPSANQVLINVKAAGVNPVDTYIRNGTHKIRPTLPYIPGKDGAGVVQQVGDQVTRVKEGDRVWFTGSGTGTYAEYCICNEDFLGELPEKYSFEEGAMIGTPYLTAFRALFQKGDVKEGETVMIHGATGGVGSAAIQMCKSLGLTVVGTAGSNHGFEMLKSIGVDSMYNHRSKGYIDEIKKEHKDDISLIIEMLANVNLQNDLEIISQSKGRIVVVGNRGNIEINPRAIMTSEAVVTGVRLGVMLNKSPQELGESIQYINSGLKAGWIKPVLWKALELENAKHAHEEIIENSGAKGQIVLKI